MTKVILTLTVFLIPILPATSKFGYEQIKVLFFIGGVSLASVFWMREQKEKKVKTGLIGKMAGIFIVCLLVTSLLGIDPKTSILGVPPYFQGLILYAYLYLFFVLIRDSQIKLELWAKILALSASLVSFISIKDWVLLNILNQQVPAYAGRVVSTFGQPNFYGGFLLLTLPFFNYLASQGETLRAWWIRVGFLISILAIILSESRVAFLLLSILILVFLSRELSLRKLIFTILGFVLLVSMIFSIFFGAGFLEKEFKEPFKTTNPDLTKIGVEKRYYFWPILWELSLEKPFTGYGLENIQPVFNKYFETNKHILFEENLKVKPYLFGLKDLYLDRSHNYILDLLLFSGILGLLVWLFLVGLLVKKLIQYPIRPENTSLLLGLFIYLIWIQFQNQSVVHLIYFWWLMGVVDKASYGG